MEEIFNSALIKDCTISSKYFISIDKLDKTFCLFRNFSTNHLDILLCETIHDENEFKITVENLTKYFKASQIFINHK